MKKAILIIYATLLATVQLLAQDMTSASNALGGCLVKSDTDDYQTGLFRIKADGTLSPLTLAPEAWTTGGGVMADGVYYCTCIEEIWEGFYYITGFTFDGESWEITEAFDLGMDLSFVATDMTYDTTTGKIYGCFYDGTFDAFEFGTMEYGTDMSRRETIAPLAVGLQAIAAAPDGQLYAVDYDGNLVIVDKSTGAITAIGGTGLKSETMASATIDPLTGVMYMTMKDSEGSRLYKIDTTTAATSIVCTFANGEEIAGLFTYDSNLTEKPEAATELSVEFDGNALTGTVSFNAPTKTKGGDALTGELGYTVTARDVTVANGTTAPGAKTEVVLTLPEAGEYEIAVVVSNTAGTSQSVSANIYAGDDTPTAAQDIKLVYANGQMRLSWEAPIGIHNGYIDQAKVTYDVTRVVGDERTTVATRLATTYFSEPFDATTDRTSVKYGVTATYLGRESESAYSNAVLVGLTDITLPYVEDFETEGILDMFTIIDANDDGKTWKIVEVEGNHVVRVEYNSAMAMDDWLITAPIKFEAGKEYSISFKASGNSPSFTEHVEAFLATHATVDALSAGVVIAERTELGKGFVTFSKTFTPTESGLYHLGIHGCSATDRYYLDVDNIRVTEGEPEADTITVPWNEDFEEEGAFESFTVIDANHDGITWGTFNTEQGHGTVARIGYNDQKEMDDWLITPPLRLDEGYAYNISFKAACFGRNFAERIEVAVGTSASVEGMNAGKRIIEPTLIESDEYVTISASFAPASTGTYHIGIHGISDADKFFIFIDDITVDEGVSLATPDGAEVNAVADESGALRAVLNIVAPTKTQTGNELTAIDRIDIERDDIVIGTLTDVVPGGRYTFTDETITKNGLNEWTVTASNSEGQGKTAHATAFVGFDVPAIVQDINVVEVSDGKVRISWSAPTKDVNGKTLTSAPTYKIIDAEYHTVVEGLAATEFTYDAVEAGEQNFVYYYIGAANEFGMGDFDMSEMILVGTPYPYPYTESFDNGATGSVFGVENPAGSNAEWELYTEESAHIPDADGTNGFIGMYGYSAGEQSSLYTGKISLVGAKKPALSFYYNALTSDNRNTMEVAVREIGKEWSVLRIFVEDGATKDYEWIKMVLPLDAYKGKTIQLRWTPTVANYPYGLIDAIKVGEATAHDLAVKSITAPARVSANKEFEVGVTVNNDGMEPADGYTVELYRDGIKVQETGGNTFLSGSRKTFIFVETLGVTADEASYSATVVYDTDENTSNNSTTECAVVTVKKPNYPVVNDLSAIESDNSIQLSWSAPDLDNLPLAAVTEDFEDAEPLSQTVDGWAFVDNDNATIGGISGITLPFSQASWFVIDHSDPTFGPTFASHSGTKHLSTMFNYQGEMNDDWMISPELCGEAQTISLWAKSYVATYGEEKMELLYSTTDKRTTSFVSVNQASVPDDWTEFTFDVPDGAKYFAIRCVSQDAYMLFVDDVTYIPTNAVAQTYSITGYNIYRDGDLISTVPASATTYRDNTTPGEHTYVVTVVYEQGESAPSNKVTIDMPDAITGTTADGITVTSGSGAIIVYSDRETIVSVYSADGRDIACVQSKARTVIPVSPGTYIVRITSQQTRKGTICHVSKRDTDIDGISYIAVKVAVK